MPNLSLGTIEVLGLPAAVEAADVALKTADVTLIGYETTDGMGMVAVKIEGQVSAVQSAVAAACAAASRITKVFATSVIPRPSDQLEQVVLTELTVGLELPSPADVSEPEPAPAGSDSDPSEVETGEPVPELPAAPGEAGEPVPELPAAPVLADAEAAPA
ncbi:BMC domain-containing protein, partial [Propionicimonas sp.]|uniref:BMC domain-containing protein n=1 Tax=Propionicimonas sp. TaxID=1955623 RepID=UPI0039E5014D